MSNQRPSGDPATRYRSRIGTGLYAQVVEILGQEIVNGELPAGTIVFADQLCERLGVSRSVMRESLRTLSSMGLLEARPQVGTTVLPQEKWDLLNPHLVKWRGQGPHYLQQMRELLELRLGVEQTAARLAANRIPPEAAELLKSKALAMRHAFEADDTHAYFEADVDFHRLLLEGTGNAILAQLADTIGAVLLARSADTRPGMHDLTGDTVDLHLKLADALLDGDAATAEHTALELVEATLHEFEDLPTEGGG